MKILSALGLLLGAYIAPAHAGIIDIAGAKPGGVVDATKAFNTSLAAHAGATVSPPLGRYLISGIVTIPAHTTLDCLYGPSGIHGDMTYGTQPALLLVPGQGEIVAGGPGAGIHGCNVPASGLTFPISGTPAWMGVAISDGGYSDFSVTDTSVVGFDTCILISGPRPYLAHNVVDCSGVNLAAEELDVGNTDSGSVIDQKIQPLGTPNTCVGDLRPGTGLRIAGQPVGAAGIALNGLIVVQGYQTRNVDIENSVIINGTLWADNMDYTCGPGQSAGVGVYVAPGAWVTGGSIVSAGSPTAFVSAPGSVGVLQFLMAEFATSGTCETIGGTWTIAVNPANSTCAPPANSTQAERAAAKMAGPKR